MENICSPCSPCAGFAVRVSSEYGLWAVACVLGLGKRNWPGGQLVYWAAPCCWSVLLSPIYQHCWDQWRKRSAVERASAFHLAFCNWKTVFSFKLNIRLKLNLYNQTTNCWLDFSVMNSNGIHHTVKMFLMSNSFHYQKRAGVSRCSENVLNKIQWTEVGSVVS